jgi:hypothetical protein
MAVWPQFGWCDALASLVHSHLLSPEVLIDYLLTLKNDKHLGQRKISFVLQTTEKIVTTNQNG